MLDSALRRTDALLPILFGLWSNVRCKGRVAESRRWVTQLMNAAETYRDADLPEDPRRRACPCLARSDIPSLWPGH
jgi:hypothetical protein